MDLEKIKQIFSNINIPIEFGGDYENENYEWIFEWIEENILPHLTDNKYTIAHGVSKVVLIPKRGKYVIKIPFNGNYSPIYDDEDSDEIIDNIWKNYFHAPENCGWDYCATEVEVYNQAKKLGIECFFANTQYLCSSKNYYPIYIQEKVKTRYGFPRNFVQPSKKSLENYKKKYKENYCGIHGVCRDNNWMALCLDTYGEEKINIFINFIQNIMPFINADMHSENYGFRMNKTPCIIDFSDWCEND